MHVKKRSGGLSSFWSGTSGTTSQISPVNCTHVKPPTDNFSMACYLSLHWLATRYESAWAFPRFWKDTVWVQTAHAENQTVFACQKGKKDSTETSTCTVWYCHRGLTLISKCLGLLLKVPPPPKKKFKLKILCLSLPSPLMFLLTLISQEITNLPPLCFLTYGHDEPFIEPWLGLDRSHTSTRPVLAMTGLQHWNQTGHSPFQPQSTF